MNAAPSRPLDVVILGNSLGHLVMPAEEQQGRSSYGAVLRDELTDSGLPVRIHLESRWFGFAVDGLARYEQDVRPHLPDVIVLNYGLNESQPWLLPVPVLRHILTNHNVTTHNQMRYRKRVVEPVWKGIRRYRRWASAKVGMRSWQTSPHRFSATMRTLITLSRQELGALVLVLDIAPPGPVLTHFLPGQQERHRHFQGLLEDLTSEFDDPLVRLVRTEDFVVEQGFPAAMPDGMHYSAAGHAHVGQLLAKEILAWAPQPHVATSVQLEEAVLDEVADAPPVVRSGALPAARGQLS
jgi:lysophospholipase L1-like esterase